VGLAPHRVVHKFPNEADVGTVQAVTIQVAPTCHQKQRAKPQGQPTRGASARHQKNSWRFLKEKNAKLM